MKVALINPPSPFLIDEKVFPNIGLVRVATQLKKNGHKVKIIDGEDAIPKSDVYGFSSTTPQFPYVYKLHEKIKNKYPNSHTVIGGAHSSALYELNKRGIADKNIKDLEVFDTIFAGEGELDNINLMFKKGWQKGKLIKNLDDVEIPNRSLIDIKSYKYELFGKPTTSIQTQRGCPYKCDFCSGRDIEMYNKIRQHSPERVLEEMDYLNKEFGFESFMWYDDEINLNQGRLEKLCKKLSDRPYQHRGFVRSDLIVKNPKSVKWMKDAGFVKLCAGVESGSDKVLKTINKQTTSKMNTQARQIIGDAGIHYESFVLMGHPGETPEDISMSYNWLKENNPDDFDINLITPYPGCKIYNDATPSNIFKDYEWEYKGLFFNKPDYSKEDSYYKGLGGQSYSNTRTLTVTNKRFKKLRNVIEKGLKIEKGAKE